MNLANKFVLPVIVAASVAGGAVGGTILAASQSAAAGTSTTTAPSTTAPATDPGPPSGTFHSNENATHETGESSAREAQETAGHFPTVP